MRRDEETQLTTRGGDATAPVEEIPALTILAHADPERVGDRLILPALAAGREVSLARLEPSFQRLRTLKSAPSKLAPLGDRSISRKPIRFVPMAGGPVPMAGGIAVDVSTARTSVTVDGARIEGRRAFTFADVRRGVVIQVGRRVVLLLHITPLHDAVEDSMWQEDHDFGLVGESAELARVRQEIRRLASLDLPVLLRGETGTGKELVARALHEAGERRGRPFVAINMATVPPSLAASELFGATRGAFTGASREKIGLFQHAEGGTLFLDEIGETPSEVQPMLLRALENNEILPVGAVEPRRIDVRVVAATDAKLASAIEAGDFRAPLLHRLSGYLIRLPTLAERREDIGRLLYFFLRGELAKMGEAPLVVDEEHPWPPAEAVAFLATYPWPGNVRQLRNTARWLAVTGRALSAGELTLRLKEALEGSDAPFPSSVAVNPQSSDPDTSGPDATVPQQTRRKLRKPSEVNEQELLGALRTHRFKINATAEALGVSRANLYRLIDDCPKIRKAVELTSEEIEGALARHIDELDATAGELEVSLRGLKRRMTELGLDYS